LKITILKEGNGKNSLKRSIAFFGFLFMSFAFCLAAYKGSINAAMFITYPTGMLILYLPSLAIAILKIFKSNYIKGDTTND